MTSLASSLPDHPYAALLAGVQKPARYVGGEVGSVIKDWDAVEARVCLAFPDVYEIGTSHLGCRILYRILNDDPRTLCERCFCPWTDLEDELRRRALPLVSLESYRPLGAFDVVGFSLQYELGYTNVLTMLDLGGIPLRADGRGEDDPLVVAGGPCATHPEPVACFFDAVVVGDGEAKLTELALAWARLRRQGVPRSKRLRSLARLEGVYVPALFLVERDETSGLEVVVPPAAELPFPIKRAVVDLGDYPFPHAGPTGGPEAVFERCSIEVSRGCTEGCRFCQAGMIYRPVRERDPCEVIETARRAVAHGGHDEVSLTALSTADVSYLGPLVRQLGAELGEAQVSLGVSSLRAYGLGPELLDELRRIRPGGLTFAPEAGTERMRAVINKNVTEAQLYETAAHVFARGYRRMKLYFMIGLPTETDADVLGIATMGGRLASIGKQVGGRRAEVTVSVSTHVPKPHTPLQWAAMDALAEIERKQALLRGSLRGKRNVTLRTHEAGGSVLEALLARGDRRLGPVIESAWRAGARFDSWSERLELDRWRAACDEHGIDPGRYLAALPVAGRLPWSHIDVGIDPGFLAREHRLALAGRPSSPCGKPVGATRHHDNVADAQADERPLCCHQCGAGCDLGALARARIEHLARLGAHRPAPAASCAPTAVAEPTAHHAATARARPAAGNPHAGHRYRLRFAKLGPAAMLGHLDLVRELPRIFRRVGERLVYSGGYHPRPLMGFAPALPLGVLALGELVDVKLVRALSDPELAALGERMTAHAPRGLRFVAARRLAPTDRAVSKLVGAARYLLAASPGCLPADAAAFVAERCRALMAAAALWVERRGERRDVRPLVLALSVPVDPAATLARAGLRGATQCVEALVALGAAGAVRAEDLAALLGPGPEPVAHRAVRVELLGPDGEPLGE